MGHIHFVLSLVELKNGNLMSGSGDKFIKIWDINTKACIFNINAHESYVCMGLLN